MEGANMTLLGAETDFSDYTYANNEGGSILPPSERVAELRFQGLSEGEAMRGVYGGSMPAEHFVEQTRLEEEARLEVQRVIREMEQQ